MAEIKHPAHLDQETNVIARGQELWEKYSKQILYAITAIVLIIAAILGYKYLVQEPNEKKASEAMFQAEQYYRMDSVKLA
ncbi:MAG TPA: hypothetical protein VKR53_10655, partial [Puia sp.]|nr:hypothetical protein [Puia sp.]